VPLCTRARLRPVDPRRDQLGHQPHWTLETEPEKTSEVEVGFYPEAPERTRVEVEHRNLERHGGGWDGMREAVVAPDGWPLYLDRFAEGDVVTRREP
jgi:hypothetical protein